MLKIFERDFGIRDFPPTKANSHFYFLSRLQPPSRLFCGNIPMKFGGFGAKTNFLDLDLDLRFFRVPFFLAALVIKLPNIQDSDYGRISIGRNFDEVKVCLLGSL